jgi:hypothetical protein
MSENHVLFCTSLGMLLLSGDPMWSHCRAEQVGRFDTWPPVAGGLRDGSRGSPSCSN